ncbi:MAG: SEC-C domain-containing protein [Alphaproteobacteria bacterium]|nr:SEC-C domain-containing protein [Alphaproteobacteria bacterium]
MTDSNPAPLRKRVELRWGPLMGTLGRSPARNSACWCGSGQRYKRCHQDADQSFRDGLSLPHGIGPGLQAIAGDVLQQAWDRPGRPLEDRLAIAQVVARSAMMAWNIVRLQPTTDLLDSLAQVAGAFPGGMGDSVVDLTARMCHRARWVQQDDPRLIRDVTVEVGDDGFVLRPVAQELGGVSWRM